MDMRCPICGSMDQTAKVSALIRSGSANGTAKGGTIGTTGLGLGMAQLSMTSSLAQSLQPPVKPKPAKEPETTHSSNGAATGGCLSVILLWTLAVILGFKASLFLDIIVFILGAILGSKIGGEIVRRSSDVAVERMKHEVVQNEIKEWPTAMSRWEKLYYCQRDDIVFLPETREHVKVSNIRRLLYSNKVE